MADDEVIRLGKYELITRLAQGGMAEILLARQPGFRDFSRLVVIKRLLPHLADQPRVVEMFVEEARLASLINHRNVVKIFDVGQQDESFFIAMEYIDGLAVSALSRRAIRSKTPLPTAVAGELVVQACEGLHAAHDLRGEDGKVLGLVHRDVSPQNLMLDRTGTLKLLDFGIAKSRASALQSQSGAVRGKLLYMSPEQCRGEVVDRRSDVFALGAVLAELLLARRLFDRPTELETTKAISEEPIPSARALDPAIPEPLDAVLTRALERDLGRRFATADEMGRALRAALDDLGLRTSHATLAEYLEANCEDLLDERSGAISILCEGGFSPSVPTLIRNFEEPSSSSSPTLVETPSPIEPSPIEPSPIEPSPIEPSGTETGAPARSARSRVAALVIALAVVTVCGLLGVWLAFDRPAALSGPTLSIVCPPFFEHDEVAAGLAPLATYLERRLSRPVEVVVADEYDGALDGLAAKSYDVALLSPLLFVRAKAMDPGIEVLAAKTYEGAHTYQSYLVTSSDSPLDTVSDLRGKRFCYVDSSSTSGYLLPRQFLRSKGLDPETTFSEVRFSGSHVEVMRDVIDGRCDAGAIFSGAFVSSRSLDVPSSKLRILAIAGQTPRGVVVASPAMKAADKRALAAALLDFRPSRDLGRPTLSTTFPIDGFVTPRERDFEDIEAAARAEHLLQ